MDARLDWKRLLACSLLAAGCVGAHGVQAQTGSDATVPSAAAEKQAREIANGDPARWHTDDATGKERLRTRQKEIGAALAEAKNACRQGPAGERPACLKAAQATWQREMDALRAQAPVAPGS